jgi:hypothetical protein
MDMPPAPATYRPVLTSDAAAFAGSPAASTIKKRLPVRPRGLYIPVLWLVRGFEVSYFLLHLFGVEANFIKMLGYRAAAGHFVRSGSAGMHARGIIGSDSCHLPAIIGPDIINPVIINPVIGGLVAALFFIVLIHNHNPLSFFN